MYLRAASNLEGMSPILTCWFFGESSLLFSESLDILVDSALHFGFDFHSLNHLNNLLLLLINGTVLSSDFGKTLINIVVITLTHI